MDIQLFQIILLTLLFLIIVAATFAIIINRNNSRKKLLVQGKQMRLLGRIAKQLGVDPDDVDHVIGKRKDRSDPD